MMGSTGTRLQEWSRSEEGASRAWLLVRIVWVAAQLVCVYWLARQSELFFYQGF
jgi:hypothetical protein